MTRIALVACAKKKQQVPTAAGDLYQSELFRKCCACAVKADRWYILSAEYGLLEPRQVVKHYDRTLNSMSKAERQAWACKVQKQLRECLPVAAHVTILAGVRYRENIEPFLMTNGYQVSVPMRGLGIGKQLQWLKQHCESNGSA